MAKTKQAKTRKVIHEHFKSLDNLLTTMETRPPKNEAFKKKENLSSQRIYDEGKKSPWAGTNTYDEAMDVIRSGYYEPLERMKKAILKRGKTEKNNRPKLKNDYVGFVPHVPNTLMNLPITMINKEKQVFKSKTIHLIYSFSASSVISASDMITGGINFISLVNSLEKQGYRVKVDIISSFTSVKTLACMTVNVKEYGQKLNLLKLTFPLVHPAMFRRIGFKWLESTPELKDVEFTMGYGTPLSYLMNYNTIKESDYLKDHGIIKNDNTSFCTVYSAMKHEDPDKLAQAIGIIK